MWNEEGGGGGVNGGKTGREGGRKTGREGGREGTVYIYGRSHLPVALLPFLDVFQVFSL